MEHVGDKKHLICKEHSGFKSDIAHVVKETEEQWTKINENRKAISIMKNWLIATLTSSLLSLLGVLIILLIHLARSGGG